MNLFLESILILATKAQRNPKGFYFRDKKNMTFVFLSVFVTWWQKCRDAESNHGRRDFQSLALPTELSRQIGINYK